MCDGRKTGINKSCAVCSSEFYVPGWRMKRNPKYCSFKCYWEAKHGCAAWNKGTKGVIKVNKGSFGKKEVDFKGTPKEYKALHYKVRVMYGNPTHCSCCGEKKNRIEWANKDHRYKLRKSDWMPLCRKCHYEYDNVEQRRLKHA